MSITKTTIPAETSHINVLKPSDAMRYLQKITQDSNVTTFMRDAIDLKHDYIKGLTKEELKEMMEEEIDEPIKRQLYEKIYELKENETTLLAATLLKSHNVRHSWVVKGMHKNDKFDLLEVHAIQKKEFDKHKLLSYGLSLLHSSSNSNETVPENSKDIHSPTKEETVETQHSSNAPTSIMKAITKEEPVDALYAYIMQDLHNKNMLNTSSENKDSWQ